MAELFELGLVFTAVGLIAIGLVVFISMLAVTIEDYLSDLFNDWLRAFVIHIFYGGIISIIVAILVMTADFTMKLWVLL